MDDNIIREVIPNNFGYPTICFSCPEKTKATLSITKSVDGFSFLEIKISSGVLPNELSGKFTRESEAEKRILNYLRNKKPTSTIKREQFAEDYKARKASKED